VLPFSSFAGIGVYWRLKFFLELVFAVVTGSGCAERRPSKAAEFCRGLHRAGVLLPPGRTAFHFIGWVGDGLALWGGWWGRAA